MPDAATTSEFRYAFYRFLASLSSRVHMVKCGVDALLRGHDGPLLRLLAGGDDLELEELSELFRSAATELGVELPPAMRERAWMGFARIHFACSGLDTLPRTSDEQVADALIVAHDALVHCREALSGRSLRKFAEVLGVTAIRGGPDDYEAWLRELERCANDLACSGASTELGSVARLVVQLVGSVSYGGAGEADVELARELTHQSSRLSGTVDEVAMSFQLEAPARPAERELAPAGPLRVPQVK